MSQFLGTLVVGCMLLAAVPAAGQSASPGKAELTIVPGGWVSFAEPDAAPEPAFSQYVVGALLAFNPGPIAIEGEFILGLGRTQSLRYGTAAAVERKSPPVFIDSINLVVPLIRGRAVVPFVAAGIGEVTVNRTRDVGQVDTETFFTGNFGGGIKWYSAGRWGLRGDYRYSVSRSEFGAPGSFFGSEKRKSQRVYVGLLVNLIRR